MILTRRWLGLVGLPRAVQFESPSSWLTRAALTQGVTVLELLDHVGWRPAGDFDLAFALLYRDGLPPELPMWAGLEVARRVLVGHQLAGCRPEGLLVAEERRRDLQRPHLQGDERGRYRFCPLCLRDDFTPFVRQEWRLDCWRYCPIHGRLMCERCGRCGGAVELPASLVCAGPGRRGIADLGDCIRCGASLAETVPQSLATVHPADPDLDRVRLANGRAMVAALYHRRLRVVGEAEDRPLRQLRLLEYLTVVPPEVAAEEAAGGGASARGR